MHAHEPVDVDELLAELVAGVDSVPEAARVAAARQALDCAGVALAAAAHPAGRAVARVVSAEGGAAVARVVGTGLVTSAAQAAWANGALAHLLDFDDTGFSHPTACLLPAGLAVAELEDASGEQLLTALVLGYEVFERIAASARPFEPALRERGWHPTSLWGCPAAAATAGRLLGLDAAQLRVAMAIAASNGSGVTQQFGTWAKGVNAGNAARAGVVAALLAREGFFADDAGVGGRYGLLSAVVGPGAADLSGFGGDLGSRWSIVSPGLGIKPWPACTSTLRAVDAMLRIAGRDGYDPSGVSRIVVEVHPDLLHTLRHRAPPDGFRGKFSLDYTVAAAALDGDLTLDSFDDAAAARPELRAMLALVELAKHPEWPLAERHTNPVTVHFADGRSVTESVPVFHGAPADPLSTAEVETKFRACAARALGADGAEQGLSALQSLPAAASVRAVVSALTPRP